MCTENTINTINCDGTIKTNKLSSKDVSMTTQKYQRQSPHSGSGTAVYWISFVVIFLYLQKNNIESIWGRGLGQVLTPPTEFAELLLEGSEL